MQQELLIIWEKWRDPFGEKNDDELDDDAFEESGYEDENSDLIKDSVTAKVLFTPMGIVPYNDNTASSKIFNFWQGHSNFDITDKVAEIIENIDGVETLDIFTRYRFRIGIGKAFDDRATMLNINTAVYNHVNNTDTSYGE
jgi:hypothetical protein